ncbi:hypothetical protein FIBSPDRAFT_896646 [Athelia psychrophila]|uniref:Uncharacterized protein n=1 Tax=Athelia psychrophila TaxID=1759441 RepID=A0A166D7C7_9AGAM|nr:hypothetical protein FIBSPDRAFT_896646 [Fibularhizoctonia sp. CBS 109695]
MEGVEMDGWDEVEAEEVLNAKSEEGEEEGNKKTRQKVHTKSKSVTKKSNKKLLDNSESPDGGMATEMNQHCLVNFAKSSTLCNVVQLKMSNININAVPLPVSYKFAQVHIEALPGAQNRRRDYPTGWSFPYPQA